MAHLEIVEVGPKLAALQENSNNRHGLLTGVGAFMKARSQQAFKDQGRPPGSWRKRKVPNVPGILRDFYSGRPEPVADRFKDSPVLLDRGDLRRSINYQVTGNAVEVGSPLKYASVHNYGGEAEALPFSAEYQAWMDHWLQTPSGKPWAKDLGWTTLPFWTGKSTSFDVPARPFVTLTQADRRDLMDLLGVEIFEPQVMEGTT